MRSTVYMRAIWNGSITFGLVNVPVKLYSATEDHDIPLHYVHDQDGGRIRYEKRCEVCGEVVPYSNLARAYIEEGKRATLLDEDLATLPQEAKREIEVVEFVPSTQVDPVMLDKSYYLAPQKNAQKAYALLKQTLEGTKRTAIVKFALRQKTRLAALRVREGTLLVQTMLWADEVREPDFEILTETPKITKRELDLSAALVKQFSADFEPEEFVDEYQDELKELIDKKLEKGDSYQPEPLPEKSEDAEVIDLMAALKASVAKARKGSAKSSKKPASKPASKTARKTASKNTAKSPAKTTSKPASKTRKTAPKSKKVAAAS